MLYLKIAQQDGLEPNWDLAGLCKDRVKNIGRMLDKINGNTSIVEHRVAQAAIKDGRETVLGKSPDVAVQINNAPAPSYHIPDDPIAASAAYQRIMQGT